MAQFAWKDWEIRKDMSQWSGGNKSTVGAMQLLVSPSPSAMRGIFQSLRPAVGSMAQSGSLLVTCIHLHRKYIQHTTAHQYYMSEGQKVGDCTVVMFLTAHTPIHASTSPMNSWQFLPTTLILILILSPIIFLFIRFQPSVSVLIKWLEVVKLRAGLYETASRDNLSLAL